MSKVLLVNQLTGAAHAIDTEGKPATVADGVLSYFEATTAMNRLAEGYVQIPWGHYAMRLDVVTHIECSESLEINGIIVLDSEGNPKTLNIYSEEDTRHQEEFGDRFGVLLAKINVENDIVSWASNPLLADAYTFSLKAAPKVETRTAMEKMLYLFKRQESSTLEPSEALIIVHVKD
jgi:hypothetical protein